MSTQIQITPASGIAVGTTAVTSGTVGRVFFQGTGDVVQQDANFTFDNTLKRLTLKAVGTAATDIVQRWRNSADTADLGYIAGDGLLVYGQNASTQAHLIVNPAGSTRVKLNASTDTNITLASSGLNQLNSGAQGWDIVSSTGLLRLRSSTLSMQISNGYLGIGQATPAARVDILAQGALSTDIIQRWRNSANSANIGIVTGDGAFTIGTYTNPSTQLSINSSLNFGLYVAGITGIYAQNTQGSGSRYAIQALGRSNVVGATAYGIRTGADSSSASTINYGIQSYAYNGTTNYAGYFDATGGTTNYALYIQRGDILFGNATTNKIAFWNKTPIVQPTTAIAAATVVSGAGGNVKHDDTFDGYTVEQVVKALRNLGILA